MKNTVKNIDGKNEISKKYDAVSFESVGFDNGEPIEYTDIVSRSLGEAINTLSPESIIYNMKPSKAFGEALVDNTITTIKTEMQIYLKNNIVNYYSAVVNAFFSSISELMTISEDMSYQMHSIDIVGIDDSMHVGYLTGCIYNLIEYIDLIIKSSHKDIINRENYVCIIWDIMNNFIGSVNSVIYSTIINYLRLSVYSTNALEAKDKDKMYYEIINIVSLSILNTEPVFYNQMENFAINIIASNNASLESIGDLGREYGSYKTRMPKSKFADEDGYF